MKRNEIVQKLMKEGFSPSTLVNMTDNQLNMLSVRILSEETVMISTKSPTYVADMAAAKKGLKTIETYEGEVKEDLKGNQKKLDKNHNGKIDSQDFKILKDTKKEVKEGRCGKCNCEECVCEKKENPSAGLSKEKKSEVVKKAKTGTDIGEKGKNFKKIVAKAKESGAKDPEAVAASAMWKNIKRENKEVNEWVDSLVENQYYSFTSKNEIMEMISTKLNEQPAIAEPDIDVEPDIREPKVNPDQDPFIDPWENPNEGPDPSPKFKKDSSDLPDFMRFKDIINSFN